MKKITIIFFFSLFSVVGASAKITLPAIVSSNMVLQRDAKVVVWGWSDEDEVMLIASWLPEELKIKVGDDGKWMTELRTTLSKEPQKIRLQDQSSSIELTNILFGEVWLCSGQSNMAQPIKGYYGQPTYGTMEAQLTARNPNIRMFRLWNFASKEPLDNPVNYAPWQEANSENILNWSAVAYFFGKRLHDYLDVPIGLISTARGGSSVQAWMSMEVLSEYEQVDLTNVEYTERTNQKIPTVFFNGMLNPLIPYSIKGALWYQGEANRSDPEGYKKLLPAMVRDWRNRWGQGDFPFYFAQIAPFHYGGNEAYEVHNNTAFMREAQLQCARIIPNSGIAITLDLGDKDCIHPPKKKEVGERLLLHALNKTYGFKSLACESPTFDSMEEKEGSLQLKFKNAKNGIYAEGPLEGFEIAGEDQVFYPAEARFESWGKLIVESKEVPAPVAVRYAWDNWVEGTLYDTNMLPVSSFRSDDWENATRSQD